MTVYYITFLAVFVLSYMAQNYNYATPNLNIKDNYEHAFISKILIILVAGILIFVAGFRYNVGTDFLGYYISTQRYSNEFFESLKTFKEPGIRFIAWVIDVFDGNGKHVIFFTSFITIALFISTIYKNTDKLTVAIMLYLFLGRWTGCFNGIRQYLAAAVLFAGLRFIKQKMFWKYALTVFIAFLFHSSAIIMIFMYFVAYNKINLRNIIILIVCSIVILFSFTEMMEFAGFVLREDVASSTNDYLTNEVSLFRIIINVAPAVVFLILYQNKSITVEQRLWLNMLILNAIMMIATSNSTYFARMAVYTVPFSIIAIPELIKGITRFDKKLVTAIFLIVFALVCLRDIAESDALNNFQWTFGKPIIDYYDIV